MCIFKFFYLCISFGEYLTRLLFHNGQFDGSQSDYYWIKELLKVTYINGNFFVGKYFVTPSKQHTCISYISVCCKILILVNILLHVLIDYCRTFFATPTGCVSTGFWHFVC